MTVLTSGSFASITSENGSCSNNNLGSATATGGSSYVWSNGATTANISGLAAGTYTVTATNNSGCTDTEEVTITNVECCNVTSAGSIGNAQSNCGGFDPDAITSIALPSGGIGTIEYVWLKRFPGQSYSAISGANGPTYDPGFITQTTEYRRCARRSGCSAFVGESNWITMTVEGAAPEYSTKYKIDAGNWIYDTVVYVCPNQKLYLGIYPNSFSSISWTGPNNFTSNVSHPLITSCVTAAHGGLYTVTASNGGCATTKTIKVIVTNNCCGEILALKIYDQSTDQEVSGIGPITNGMSIPASSLPTNYYLVVETTTSIESVNITVNGSSQSFENVVPYTWPNGAENGSNWNGGGGSYTVKAYAYTVENCANTLCDEIEVSFTVSDCDNVTDGGTIGNAQSSCDSFDPEAITSITAPLGGSGTLEYIWFERIANSSSMTEIVGATSATYDPGMITQSMEYMRASKRDGCTEYVGESNWVLMSIENNLTVEVNTMSPLCAGTDGSADAMAYGASGNVSYLWSNGSTMQMQVGLGSGTYIVTATDAGGCTAVDSGSVVIPEPILLSFTVVGSSYPGAMNGSAQVSVTGGTPAYTYLWGNGSTTNTATGLQGGINHGVMVVDANGCMAIDSVFVNSVSSGKTGRDLDTEGTIDEELSLVVFPNPISTGATVTLGINGVSTDMPSQIEIMDVAGNMVRVQRALLNEGANQIVLEDLDRLAAGTYIVRVNMNATVRYERIQITK